MTQFEQLKILYNQYSNLSDEITKLICDEDYDSIFAKMQYKENLMQKLVSAKNTTNLTEDEAKYAFLIEKELWAKEQNNIVLLSKLHKEIGETLKDTNKKVKINSAYNMVNNEKTGLFCDLSE